MARKRNPYKKIDKFLNSMLPVKMMAATTWRDFLHVFMLDLAKTGAVNPNHDYHGIPWRTHVADGMYIDGKLPVISKKTGKILEKPFARYFELTLDRIFYIDEEKKDAHFVQVFSRVPAMVQHENKQLDGIFDLAWDNRKSFANDEITRQIVREDE